MNAELDGRQRTVNVSVEQARTVTTGILAGVGASDRAARDQATLLLEAELRGRPSHGLQRLPTLVERVRRGLLCPSPNIRFRWAARATLEVDGGAGFGPHVAHMVISMLKQPARGSGVALGAIRNTSHLGMLAPYLESIAGRGLIGMAFTTSEALVHPTGGTTPLVGTNPLGIAIPAPDAPFVLDMSTAAISAGEIMAHAQRGRALPEGVAIDADGQPTTSPELALMGAISPFGGGKGYGLGLGLELLVAILTRTGLGREVTGTLDVEHRATKGDVFLLIDPSLLGIDFPVDAISRYLQELRTTPPAPGFDGVLVPGDRARTERARRLTDGLTLPAPLWTKLEELHAEVERAER